ncbi:hypothetical protein [Streptomyces sp. NPDC018000]|uniref:hypothetical protein n=1 Tax=Streptomyces sp. NPDC018000 TaxID=3365028 RepID=UPI003791C297
MKTTTRAIAAAVAAGLLVACGSNGSAGNGGLGGSSPSAEASPKPSVKAPEGFDPSKSWHASVDWLPEDDSEVPSLPPVEAAPKAGIVAFLQRKGEGYVVEARDAATGKLRWNSQKWQPPVAGDNGDSEQIPRLLVVHEDGHEYVAVWAYSENEAAPGDGASGKGASSTGISREEPGAVSLVFYRADSSGKDVAPARTVAVPADDDNLEVTDGGNGAVVQWVPHASVSQNSATVEISKNRVQSYEHGKVELPPFCVDEGWENCIGGKVAGLSPDGPVVSLQIGGFGVGGAWASRDAIPPGVRQHKADDDGDVWLIIGDHVISTWSTDAGAAGWGARPLYAAHDLKSGKLKMSVVCDAGAGPEGIPFRPVLSANGRYAVAGALALDFEQRKAHCLDEQATGTYKDGQGIQLFSVGDDGIAYGYQEDGNRPVAVPLDTGKAKALPEGTEVPFLSLPEAGGFTLRKDGAARQFVFHPRR